MTLNTKGFPTTRSDNIYSCSAFVETPLRDEIFTKLLYSPRVFNVFGKTNAEANANLDEHIKSRLRVVDYARKLIIAIDFGVGSEFKMNPDYWQVTSTGFALIPGKDPKQALQDVTNGLDNEVKKYVMGCEAAAYLAMAAGDPKYVTDFTDENDWIPGDWGYIENESPLGIADVKSQQDIADYAFKHGLNEDAINRMLVNRLATVGQHIIYLGTKELLPVFGLRAWPIVEKVDVYYGHIPTRRWLARSPRERKKEAWLGYYFGFRPKFKHWRNRPNIGLHPRVFRSWWLRPHATRPPPSPW